MKHPCHVIKKDYVTFKEYTEKYGCKNYGTREFTDRITNQKPLKNTNVHGL